MTYFPLSPASPGRPLSSLVALRSIMYFITALPCAFFTTPQALMGFGWVSRTTRPILVGFSPLPLAHLQATFRFNQDFGDLKRLQIKRFAPSAPQLQKFHSQLQATWHPLPAPPVNSFQAEQQLDHLTQVTLDAAPARKKWKKHFSLEQMIEQIDRL